jgi:peptidyl-prolyl cis-trans isomerase SurA
MRFSLTLLLVAMLLPQQQVADRVVAVVDDEPIMLSELRQTLPPGFEGREDLPQLMRTNLEALINQALILEEIKRLKLFTITDEEIERAIEMLSERFGSREALEAELRSQGLTLEGLRESLRSRLLVLKFVDYRFRRYNEIEEERIRQYYEGEWSQQYRSANPGAALPPFEEVRDQLEQLLIERHVNEQLDAWLEKARENARILIKF